MSGSAWTGIRIRRCAGAFSGGREDHGEAFGNLDPEMGGLANRPADNWRPLFSVAELAGGEWPARIREAAGVLMDRAEKRAPSERYPEMLLADVREVFERAGDPQTMTGKALDRALHDMTERPWPTCSRGKPLPAQMRGRYLARFGVQSQTLHLSRTTAGEMDAKGYVREALVSAWNRYLPTAGGSEPSQPSQGNGINEIADPPNRPTGEGAGRFNGSENVNESGGRDGWDGSIPPQVPDPTNGGALSTPAEWSAALASAEARGVQPKLRERAEGWREVNVGPFLDRWPGVVPADHVEASFRDPKSGSETSKGRAYIRLRPAGALDPSPRAAFPVEPPAPLVEVEAPPEGWPTRDTNGHSYDLASDGDE